MQAGVEQPDSGPQQSSGAPSNTYNAALILFSRIVAFAISTALPLLLVRKLEPTSFGLYKQVFLVVNTALNVMPLGFGMNVYYFLPRKSHNSGAVVFNTILALLATGLLTAALLITQPRLLTLVSKEPQILPFAPLIGGVIVLWIITTLAEIVPIANQEMKLAMVYSIGNQIVRTGAFLTAAILFGTIESLIWAAIVYGVIAVGVLLYYLHSRFPGFFGQLDGALLKRQLSYCIPIGLMGLVWYFQSDLHNYFVSNQYGAEAFAIYSVGCFQLPLVQLLLEAGSSVLIAQIAKLQEAGDTDQIIFLTLRAMRKLAAALFPSYAFLLVASHEFIRALFTSEYDASWPVFVINITIIPMSVLLFDPIMRAYAEYRFMFLQAKIGLFAVLLASLWWATPRFGLVGAISSVIGVAFLDKLLQVGAFVYVLKFRRRHVPLLGDTFKIAVAAAVAAVGTAALRMLTSGQNPWIALAILGVAFTLLYVPGLKLLGVIQPEEMDMAKRAVSRFVQKIPLAKGA